MEHQTGQKPGTFNLDDVDAESDSLFPNTSSSRTFFVEKVQKSVTEGRHDLVSHSPLLTDKSILSKPGVVENATSQILPRLKLAKGNRRDGESFGLGAK